MTKPQDKMRSEFEANMTDDGTWPRAVERCADGEYLLMSAQIAWTTWQAAWQAACAQQSAQSQQDALDAARYRWLEKSAAEIYGVYKSEDGEISTIAWDSEIDDELSSVIDAAIATQSNGEKA